MSKQDQPFQEEEIAEWWRYILETPKDENPTLGGQYVQVQNRPTICLVCTLGGIDDKIRKLNLSGDMLDIIIGVFTSAYSKEEANVASEQEVLERARKEVEDPEDLILKINGSPYEPIYAENSTGFEVNAPDNNVMGLSGQQKYKYFAAGFFSRLKPEGGKVYEIEFGGTRGKAAASQYGAFKTNVKYEVRT